MASPTAVNWLTMPFTTWFNTPTDAPPPYTLAYFTCPDVAIAEPTAFKVDTTTVIALPYVYSISTSTTYTCSYLIADVRAVSTTGTDTSTVPPTTHSATHSTATPTRSAATHVVTHTKTNVGAIAGAAIGAAILGLIVGAVICYLCLGGKKRKRRDSLNNEATAMTTFLPPAPPPKERLSSRESVRNDALLASAAAAAGIEDVLSSMGIHKGASDEEIKSELSALGYLLQEHVQNNYHLDHLDGSRNEVFRISQALSDPAFGLDDRSHALILKLSQDPQTRFAAIRHFLALSIFSALDLHHIRSHPGSVSLLPRQVTSFLGSIPSAEIKMGKNNMTPQTATALSLWRRLSAYLLLEKPSSSPMCTSQTSPTSPISPINVTNNILPNAPEDRRCSSTTITSPTNQNQGPISTQSLTPPSAITAQVTALRASLNKFLGMFVHSDRRAIFDQERNLEGVIHECVSFGYVLFAHGCEWRFIFDAAPVEEEEHGEDEEGEAEMQKGTRLLVLPGLEKLGDGKGKVYEVPEVVLEGESVVI
ncbi:hypothetical protein QBC32DRAFT_22139 [Pseudoneurospora amorphoporcata]|uniref:Uncharacterized protein n=1 Tax=Pseudoneurospora amorphoporcata TaxID=241081 RepID=A0AAN6SJU2_9PEZI|nr:hypothetical protein QBC32DRAFT_22139 [Pseudoneurospora amorphoporcata]